MLNLVVGLLKTKDLAEKLNLVVNLIEKQISVYLMIKTLNVLLMQLLMMIFVDCSKLKLCVMKQHLVAHGTMKNVSRTKTVVNSQQVHY